MNALDPIQRRDLLVSASAMLFGFEWQRAIARALGPFHPEGARDSIDDRLVRRWASGERPIPDWVIPALARIVDSRATELGTLLIRLSQPETRNRTAASREFVGPRDASF